MRLLKVVVEIPCFSAMTIARSCKVGITDASIGTTVAGVDDAKATRTNEARSEATLKKFRFND